MPAETIVKPITVSLTPKPWAAAIAPFTNTWEPITNNTKPTINFVIATGVGDPPASAPRSSAASEGSSLAERISQTKLIIVPATNARPAIQVIRPPEAIPQVAIETPKRRGTSCFTKRLFTRSGITAALAPSTTSTLKIFEPTILLTAIASPALPPLRVESRLTNSSGALVPKDTTVRPITIWGIPNNNESATEPATNNSPPPNNNKMPIIIKPKSIRKGGVIRFANNF